MRNFHFKGYSRILTCAAKSNAARCLTLGFVGAIVSATASLAATCPSYTYSFTNGTIADATQVNTNFSTIMTCADTLLAPLASPVFTGTVGIGTSSSPASLFQTNDTAAQTTSYTGILHDVFDTSSTASINKVGMDIESTGSWSGTGAINTGLVVNATGGTTNYAATFNGGNVGIGNTAPAAVLQTSAGNNTTTTFPITNGVTAANYYIGANINSTNFTTLAGSTTTAANLNYTTLNPSSALTSANLFGQYNQIIIPASATHSTTGTLIGTDSRVYNNGSANLGTMDGFRGLSDNYGTGTVTNATGVEAFVGNLNNGSNQTTTLTNSIGVYAMSQNSTTGGTLTFQYGLFSGTNNTGTVANGFGVYISGEGTGGTWTNQPFDLYASDTAAYNYFAGKVGIGTLTPAQALQVHGEVQIDTFASASATAVCENANVLSSCSSSIRYKENVKDAPFGLNEIMQMRPVTFKWKGRDENDLGLIAEEVAKINPLFATTKDGKIEGVKYAQLTAVLVNAIKQLKNANDVQAAQIAQLQTRVAELQRKTGVRTAMSGAPERHAIYASDRR